MATESKGPTEETPGQGVDQGGSAVQKDAESSSARLPFEPNAARKKAERAAVKKTRGVSRSSPARENGIPEVVSKRMARRMAYFAGIPSVLSMVTFILSYVAIQHYHMQVPTVAVLLVSLLFFGLGVVGLSYGMLSASWDEEPGSLFGLEHVGVNFGRMTEAFRAEKGNKR
ncbi:MAG: DUF3464 family protein [Alkalinema sp. RU_4_3]|nr:DUF3464 family protein [Alkalinema sp. RU_4_3]